MNKKKVFIFIIILILIATFLTIFFINRSKTQKIGKNSSSQDIVNYILDISSYEAIIEVETKSNKNSNKYVLKQQYIKDNASTQEVLEPSNIQGVRMVKKDKTLKLENTALNVVTILENYECITDNALDLSSFVENYRQNRNSNFEEKDNQIIMYTTSDNDNKYTKNKILYVDRSTAKPIKMEVTDINKNTTISILYKEVEIDNLEENNVLAFNLFNMSKQI